jgi:hypothetical protein
LRFIYYLNYNHIFSLFSVTLLFLFFNLALIIIQSDGLRDLKEVFFNSKQEVFNHQQERQ